MYPKLRFKEFDDAWEQRKLGEFVRNVAKKNKDNLDLEPYSVTNDRGFIAQKDAHDDFGYMKNTDRSAYNIVPPNSFAYNPARINVGSLGYYEGSVNVIVSSLYEVFQTDKTVEDRFLYHWLKSDLFPKWIEKLQEGSVRLYFYFDKLIQCKMSLPSIEEQKKISNYLDCLDNLITLHQRQCEVLKKQKQFFLKNMFPKEGESVPKIRFNGFTEPWEQREFDEVFNYLVHNSLSRDDLNDNEGSIKNIHYGDVLIKFGNVIDTKHESIPYVNDNVKLENKACFLQDGDIVIADAAEDSTVGKCTEISESNDQKIVSGLHTIPCRPKNKFAKGFLGYYLNSNAYHDQLLPLMQGTKVSSISKSSLKETTINFPSSIEEQKKVGACFYELDNLITLHQQQYEQLVSLKKYLLSKMFI